MPTVAHAAHELRTPLHGILGAAELLLASPLDAAQREHAETIEEAARALLRVADDVLAAAAAGAPPEIAAAECDVRALAEGVRRLLAPAARAKGLALTVAVDASVPGRVRVDGGRLRQALVNLVGNAVKFTDAGAVALVARADVTGETPNGSAGAGALALTVEVRDTGPGLTDGAYATLFRPDATPAPPGARPGGGAGVGLSVTADLVTRMGGAVGARPPRAGAGDGAAGATFWLTVPVTAVAASPNVLAGSVCNTENTEATRRAGACPPPPSGCGTRPHPTGGPRVLCVAHPGGGCANASPRRVPNALPGALALGGPVGRLAGLRALVVDDDPVARRVTAALLERLGCAVDASAGAAEGAAATHLYDLLVLDLRLADGDGLDCAAAVWEDDRRRGISATPAVVLTASACAETRARCAAAGVGACVEKPAGAVALGEAACDALARGALDPGALAALRALAADAPDDPLLARVAADYARQATRHLRALDAAIAAGDTDGVERAAHVLRGASASAGARRAALAAAALTAGGAPPLLVDAARLRTLVTAAARALAAAAADRA